MKLKFKTQAYQTAAVQAVVDCFKGQPPAAAEAVSYRIDPGKAKKGIEDLFAQAGSKTPT
jgi:type III restriction enzyme